MKKKGRSIHEIFNSIVERRFFEESGRALPETAVPYIVVENFPKLGLITACRFLEWVMENPEGVVSLPTGKTPEYFIKWTQWILNNWNSKKCEEIKEKFEFTAMEKPDLHGLHFVQIDEFYPISPEQTNSFYHYVKKYYIDGFNLDESKSLLINCNKIELANGDGFDRVFPRGMVDLSLRYREPASYFEEVQQQSIFMIDQWCSDYETHIRELGGIGFFLGGIGPDGHIAFNIRGSDLHSTTRLTDTNFETKAVAAGDLGGIEVSSKRLVITIGLETIVHNPDAVAIIFAAGEAKSGIIRKSLESEMSNLYPATILQTLKNSRFYLTGGAASALTESMDAYYKNNSWTSEKTDRSIIDLCVQKQIYGHRLTSKDLNSDPYASMIPGPPMDQIQAVIDRSIQKIKRGLERPKKQRFLHTGPHHDDISLGILPYITQQLREFSNEAHFAVLTSGFTAVTNAFVIDSLKKTLHLLSTGQIQMIKYPDFFSSGYRLKTDKDIYHFLTNVAAENPSERERGLCHRLVRAMVLIYGVGDCEDLVLQIKNVIEILEASYDGEKNPPEIQKLKGMIREFEEELVWAHFGVQVKNVHHLRLGFYTGDIFTDLPEKDRDVQPIVELFREIDPTCISLTLDPEGSGPDTHYKVLQATAEAVKQWSLEKDLSELRIIGYRNVWYQFHPAEANVIVPVSLSDMSVMEESFSNCYLSQVNASFPSYRHNGKFSTLARRIWVQQLKDLQLLLGKNFFYQHEIAKVRSSHGLIFFKEMNVAEFLQTARDLEKVIDG
ncbi:MAG: glucosamine-6-phosphate isomerase [Saprospirales bacterium]|nr:MAG: glucosamine-6-phosphate isomerase [Saprospirales bacterium]